MKSDCTEATLLRDLAETRQRDIDRVAALIRNDGSPTPHIEVVNYMRAMMNLPPLKPEDFVL